MLLAEPTSPQSPRPESAIRRCLSRGRSAAVSRQRIGSCSNWRRFLSVTQQSPHFGWRPMSYLMASIRFANRLEHCVTQVEQGRELSNARLFSLIHSAARIRRSRTVQAITSSRAASVISRTNAMRTAVSASDLFGLVGGVFIEL